MDCSSAVFVMVLISVHRGEAGIAVEVSGIETKISSENFSSFFLLGVFPNLKYPSSNAAPTTRSPETTTQTQKQSSQLHQCSELAVVFDGINQQLRTLEGQIKNMTAHVKGNIEPLENQTKSETSCKAGFTQDRWYRSSNGYEYKYVNKKLTFLQAANNCKRLDSSSTLATVGGRTGILGSGIDASGMGIQAGDNYFVGATDAVKEDIWIFLDGGVMNTRSITNWGNTGPQEPNGGRREQCMMWCHAGGRTRIVGLGDASCDALIPSMCERKTTACKLI